MITEHPVSRQSAGEAKVVSSQLLQNRPNANIFESKFLSHCTLIPMRFAFGKGYEVRNVKNEKAKVLQVVSIILIS